MQTIGERIKEFARTKFGSITALAKALHMKPQSLNSYISNKIRPGVDVQNKLRVLGADVEYLMTGKSKSLESYVSESDDANEQTSIKVQRDERDEKDMLIYYLSKEVKVLREQVDYYRSRSVASTTNEAEEIEDMDTISSTIAPVGKAAATPLYSKKG